MLSCVMFWIFYLPIEKTHTAWYNITIRIISPKGSQEYNSWLPYIYF